MPVLLTGAFLAIVTLPTETALSILCPLEGNLVHQQRREPMLRMSLQDGFTPAELRLLKHRQSSDEHVDALSVSLRHPSGRLDNRSRCNRYNPSRAFAPEFGSLPYVQVAALAEFRADWATAVKTYQAAYLELLRINPVGQHPLQRWTELTSVAEIMHLKVLLLISGLRTQ